MFVDRGKHKICKMTNGIVATLALESNYYWSCSTFLFVIIVHVKMAGKATRKICKMTKAMIVATLALESN